MEFGILGPLSVRHEGRDYPVTAAKLRILLAALLLRSNRPVPPESLVELVWGRRPPAAARDTLRSYVMRLRRSLPAEPRLRTGDQGYLIEVRPGELDVDRFGELVDRARRATGDWVTVRAGTQRALALWRDRPLLDVPSADLQREAVPPLEELHWEALELWAEAGLNLGDPAGVAARLRAALSADPLREPVVARLMVALARSGRQAEALEQYRRTRERLVAELGVEPGPGLRAAHTEVLMGGPPEPRPRPAQLPADLADFTGRLAELAALLAALRRPAENAATAVVVVSGTGGIGKTVLAVHAAHLTRSRFPDGVLYAGLRGSGRRPVVPAELLGRFLRDLGTPPRSMPADPGERAALFRSLTGDARLLVVLDDAGSVAQLRPLLPGGPNCAVLVTSRRSLADLIGSARVDVEPLDPDASRALLSAVLGDAVLAADEAATATVIRACAGLPLALRVVAARVTGRLGWSLPTLAARLADPATALDELTVGALRVRHAFASGYEGLPGADRRRAFRMLALSDGPAVSVAAAAAMLGRSERRAGSVLEDLAERRLIGQRSPGRYGYHDLLRAYARELGRAEDPAPDRAGAVHRLLSWYLAGVLAATRALGWRAGTRAPAGRGHRFAGPDDAARWLDAEYPALLAACKQAADAGLAELAWQLPTALWSYFDRHGLGDDCIATHTDALRAVRRGGDRRAEARTRNNLAVALLRAGRPEQARGHLHRARALHAALGDQRGVAAALANLAEVARAAGRPDPTEAPARRSLPLDDLG